LNDQKPEDIATADLHFVNDIGLSEHLSPTRQQWIGEYDQTNETIWSSITPLRINNAGMDIEKRKDIEEKVIKTH
jgi:hypothetical protein